jgi:hypothetical protein
MLDFLKYAGHYLSMDTNDDLLRPLTPEELRLALPTLPGGTEDGMVKS